MNPLVGDDGLPLMTADGLAAVAECPGCCAPVTYFTTFVCGGYSGPPIYMDSRWYAPGAGVCAAGIYTINGVNRCVIVSGVAGTPPPTNRIILASLPIPQGSGFSLTLWRIDADCCSCQPGCDGGLLGNPRDIIIDCVPDMFRGPCCGYPRLSVPFTVSGTSSYTSIGRDRATALTTIHNQVCTLSPLGLVNGRFLVRETCVRTYTQQYPGAPPSWRPIEFTETTTRDQFQDAFYVPGQQITGPPFGVSQTNDKYSNSGCFSSSEVIGAGGIFINATRQVRVSCSTRRVSASWTSSVRDSETGRELGYQSATISQFSAINDQFANNCGGRCTDAGAPITDATNPEDLL